MSSPSGYGDDFGLPKILVIGCGGAGNNAVSRLARYGLSVEEANMLVMTAIGGDNQTVAFDGRARFPVNVRYAREYRESPDALARLQGDYLRSATEIWNQSLQGAGGAAHRTGAAGRDAGRRAGPHRADPARHRGRR